MEHIFLYLLLFLYLFVRVQYLLKIYMVWLYLTVLNVEEEKNACEILKHYWAGKTYVKKIFCWNRIFKDLKMHYIVLEDKLKIWK